MMGVGTFLGLGDIPASGLEECSMHSVNNHSVSESGRGRIPMGIANGTKPFPERGWWKGLTAEAFWAQLTQLSRDDYKHEEIAWTHDVVDPAGRLIGEVGDVEEVSDDDPSPWVTTSAIRRFGFVHLFETERYTGKKCVSYGALLEPCFDRLRPKG
jgi:hypothetical protein